MKKASQAQAPWDITADMFLSEREVTELLAFIRDRQTATSGDARTRATVDRLIIEILLFSGLRNSELCHLRVRDALEGKALSAIRVLGTPKQDRWVYIPANLWCAIEQYIRETRGGGAADDANLDEQSQTLILNERGRPYDRTALYRRVVRILTEAGLKDRASVQLLRHTYGFLAYKRTGGNLLFVQQQLGHAHPMVTAIYAQFVEFSYSHLANHVGGEVHAEPLSAPKRLTKPTRDKGKSA
ncbi:tyrosine-type recombinase/integrase [Schlesneria paludicola]|uniref:tyrosine-type recombinase/integrase n=1 Tax=Schlesneria paludicola TaxID=360056 RepID=UPI00029A34E0|nr:site-specific integrase [Schlesneria paludicola]